MSRARRREAIEGYLHMLPWIIGFIVFTGGPMLVSLYLSFTEYRITSPPNWIGLTNYQTAFFEDKLFWSSLGRTFYFALVAVPLGLIGSLLLAMLLNQGVKGASIFRTIFFLPGLTPIVAAALVWTVLLQPETGIINYLLSGVGIPGPRWFGSVEWAISHISEPGQVGLMMNLDHFEQAGIEPLTWDSSMDDLLDASLKIVEATSGSAGTKTFGFARSTNYFNWVTHIRSFGGDFLDPEGVICVLDDEKALAAVQHLYDLAYEYEVAPSPAQVGDGEGSMFQGGSLAMVSAWPVNTSQWPMSITDFRANSTMIPPGPEARGSMLNQHMMSIAAASQNKEVAWEWVKWSCSADFSRTRALAGRGGPVGMPAVWHDEEILSLFPSWREWAQVMDDVGPNYTAANLRGKELEDTFNQGAAAIMVQDMGVAEGLAAFREACQDVLDKPIAT